MRMKGSTWYFSDVITAVTSMFGTLFMLFMAALILFVMSSQLDVNVTGGLLYDVPRADAMLLTFLDSSSNGYQMKELLDYAVVNDSMNVTINGQAIDVKKASAEVMAAMTDEPYSINIQSTGLTEKLASKGAIEVLTSKETVNSEAVVYGGGVNAKLTLVIVK
ncbi:MAG: hypothetical protein V1887_00935 [Candidatus Aenigmatarchaeota archaeon]